MRIGSLFLICVFASAFTLGCAYDEYVSETKDMSNKLKVFQAAQGVVSQYAFPIRENKTLGEIDAIMPMDTRFFDATRGRIFVKIYKISPSFYEPEVRVIYDIDTSEPSSTLTGGRPVMQEWAPVFYAKALEVKIKNEIFAKLGMKFKTKKMLKADGYPAPEETEPVAVAEAPEAIKKAREALKTKIPLFESDGFSLEAALKELSGLTGLNIVSTGEAMRLADELGVKIKLNVKGLTAKAVLDQILNNAGEPFFRHVTKDGVIMIDVF